MLPGPPCGACCCGGQVWLEGAAWCAEVRSEAGWAEGVNTVACGLSELGPAKRGCGPAGA
jgi:hypothetical protein